jgi:ABC-2 type transport system permease protein
MVKMRLLLLLQYRAAALAGIATQLMWGFLKVMVLQAFYLATNEPQPLALEQAVGYVWLGQAMLRMLPWDGDLEVQELIRNGNVAYELCRPVDLYGLWYARALALRAAPTILRAVPVFALALYVLPESYALRMPSAGGLLAWLLATVGALLLGCAMTNLMNISMFWTISGEGINRLMPAVIVVFSGMLVPLPLFPDWAQRVLEILPFAGLMDTPARFFVGQLAPSEVWVFLTRQFVWTVVLVVGGRWLLRRGLRRVVVQGG